MLWKTLDDYFNVIVLLTVILLIIDLLVFSWKRRR
jgi:hypothetical protein